MLIFAAAVVAWADHTAPLLLGLSASWLPWHQENGPAGPASSLLGRSPLHRVTLQEALTLLPSSMPLLLQKEPWKEQTQKVRRAATCFRAGSRFLFGSFCCRIAVGDKCSLSHTTGLLTQSQISARCRASEIEGSSDSGYLLTENNSDNGNNLLTVRAEVELVLTFIC